MWIAAEIVGPVVNFDRVVVSYHLGIIRLFGAEIFLDEASVMATENALMAAAAADGDRDHAR